ncbi:MAG: type II toxin-antitoxin system HicB family antitoxin [Nitrospinota bacterium]
MKHYIGLIRKEKGSCYGVDFPDFPGCITAGDTAEEAQANAVAALDLHVAGMIEDGERLPKATGLDEILEEPDNLDGLVLAVQVPLIDKKSKRVRVDITIPKDLSNQVDKHVSRTEGVNRSSFFTTAGAAYLQHVSRPVGKRQGTVKKARSSAMTVKTKTSRKVSKSRSNRKITHR